MLSKKYKNWIGILDPKMCHACYKEHGKIYGILERPNPNPKLHSFCRCVIQIMKALKAGTATQKKRDGADFWLKYKSALPDYYISKKEAKLLGYKSILGNLNRVAPGKMLAKGIYKNLNEHLPKSEGRIWYEADIDYKSGYRNTHRILYSNDGLIFVTYDHYKTFYEIV